MSSQSTDKKESQSDQGSITKASCPEWTTEEGPLEDGWVETVEVQLLTKVKKMKHIGNV